MLNWKRSSKCDNSGPNCVEVAHDETTGTRYVRDNKNPNGPMLAFTADEWTAFEDGIRANDRF